MQLVKSTSSLSNAHLYYATSSYTNRCGFAKSQKAYDRAINELTESFDRLEEILSTQRYIAGDKFTLSDIRLFVMMRSIQSTSSAIPDQ